MKNKWRYVSFAGVAVLLLLLTLCSCSSNAPALEDVQDRFVELIEASHEVNEIFFWRGSAHV